MQAISRKNRYVRKGKKRAISLTGDLHQNEEAWGQCRCPVKCVNRCPPVEMKSDGQEFLWQPSCDYRAFLNGKKYFLEFEV